VHGVPAFQDRIEATFGETRQICPVKYGSGPHLKTGQAALERDEQVAKWIALNAQKVSQEHSVQTAPIGHRPRSGINEASRQLGIESTDAKRAVNVASLSDEAKEAAREVGLDEHQTNFVGCRNEIRTDPGSF